MGWKHHKFPIETLKTSDFFAPNLGCLCPKPRYFPSKKSDVFGFRTLFYAEIPGFSPFLPRNPQSPTLVFSPPVPPLLGSEALLSAPKSQIILTKSPSSSSRGFLCFCLFQKQCLFSSNIFPASTVFPTSTGFP